MKRNSILSKIVMVLIVVMVLLTGCGKSPEAARKELAALNVEYTTDGFLKSVEANDMVAIKLFIEAGMDVNTKNMFGRTPLMIASEKGHLDIVKYLLGKSADVNVLSSSKESALDFAIVEEQIEVIKLLLDKGANVNNNESLKEGWTTLILALGTDNLEIVSLIVDKGADVNLAVEGYVTPLIGAIGRAIETNDYSIVELLLTKGANVNVVNPEEDNMTLLMAAIMNDKETIVKMLLENAADVNAATDGGITPLMYAILNENPKIIDLVLANQPEINVTDMQGFTPLLAAIKLGNKEIVETLLTKGANPNFKTHFGLSPLELATDRGEIAIIEILKKAGAEGETKASNNSSSTLYKYGVFSNSKQEQVFKSLVKDKYDLFVETFESILEEDDLDGFGATVNSGAVPGLYTIMEAIVMVDKNDTIWAAIIDNDVVRYYTNSSNKTKLPATIENWRSRFTEYKVVFMNK